MTKLKHRFNKLLLQIGGGISLLNLSFSVVSCSNDYQIEQQLKDGYYDWYNSLTDASWNRDEQGNWINYYCNSEQQAIILYANWRGWFFNQYLHHEKNYPVPNQLVRIFLDPNEDHEVRGNDYQFISSALEKAICPKNIVTYHGVEYMETEFWDQLKEYIIQNDDGTYNYDNVVGKTIESYGFISSTPDKESAKSYSDGKIFNNIIPWDQITKTNLPLKERVCFKINIKKRYRGAAYLADFNFAGYTNPDNQILINLNCRFLIKNVWKEGDINMFEVDLL